MKVLQMCTIIRTICSLSSQGNATLHLFPNLKDLQKMHGKSLYLSFSVVSLGTATVKCSAILVHCITCLVLGVVDYLTTEISTSKQKRFSLVTFIDTPGLVDGDMKYPFDVDETITWLGETSDLVFVLFDPLGQALCKRTLNIVGTYMLICCQWYKLIVAYFSQTTAFNCYITELSLTTVPIHTSHTYLCICGS